MIPLPGGVVELFEVLYWRGQVRVCEQHPGATRLEHPVSDAVALAAILRIPDETDALRIEADSLGRGRTRPLNARPPQTALPGLFDDPNRAIRAPVVDDDDLRVEPLRRQIAPDARERGGEADFLVEGGNDDRQQGRVRHGRLHDAVRRKGLPAPGESLHQAIRHFCGRRGSG